VCAALLLVGSGAWALRVSGPVREHGWAAAVPTAVLVRVAPVEQDRWHWVRSHGGRFAFPRHALVGEVQRRHLEGRLSARASRVFLARVFAEHPDLVGQLIEHRDRWPREMPLRVAAGRGLSLPFALPGLPGRVYVRARVEGSGGPWELVGHGWMMDEERGVAWLGGWPADGARLEVEVLVERYSPNSEVPPPAADISRAKPVFRASLGPVRAVDSGVISPAEGIDAERVAELLNPRLYYRDRSSEPMLVLDRRHGVRGAGDAALGLEVLVLEGGVVAATGRVLYDIEPPSGRGADVRPLPVYTLRWHRTPPTREQLGLGGWTVRLSGSAEIAVLDVRRDTYWAGSVEAPLAEFLTSNQLAPWSARLRAGDLVANPPPGR
jgi:hypothetical protein